MPHCAIVSPHWTVVNLHRTEVIQELLAHSVMLDIQELLAHSAMLGNGHNAMLGKLLAYLK